MTREQWQRFTSIVRCREYADVAVALIADSPWLPGFAGLTTREYLTDSGKWLDANLRAFARFPEVIFLPGAWVEFGVAIEPSALGCEVVWWDDSPPTAIPLLRDASEVTRLSVPNPETDGLMAVTLERQRLAEPILNEHGHETKAVVARGPLAIASQVRGVTDFLTDIKLEPEYAHELIRICTETAIMWLRAQAQYLPAVEAVQVHDDIVGLLSPVDYEEFAHPYLSEVFSAFPEHMHIYHNDSPGIRFFPRLADTGIDVLNFSHLSDIGEVDEAIGDRVCLMGNVPPLDVLVRAQPADVKEYAGACVSAVKSGLLLSAGGGLSPGTPAENIDALIEAIGG